MCLLLSTHGLWQTAKKRYCSFFIIKVHFFSSCSLNPHPVNADDHPSCFWLCCRVPALRKELFLSTITTCLLRKGGCTTMKVWYCALNVDDNTITPCLLCPIQKTPVIHRVTVGVCHLPFLYILYTNDCKSAFKNRHLSFHMTLLYSGYYMMERLNMHLFFTSLLLCEASLVLFKCPA